MILKQRYSIYYIRYISFKEIKSIRIKKIKVNFSISYYNGSNRMGTYGGSKNERGVTLRILVVEDEVNLAEALTQILKKNNYTVDTALDGVTGLDYALSDIYDVVVLDVMLPKMNGVEVVNAIRKEGISVPVIMLTAKNEIADKVKALDSGADDYLAKPFVTEELLARIRALGRRRGEVPKDNSLKFGDIELDPSSLQLTKQEKNVKLTLKESELLALLITRKGMVTSKEKIIEKLWGFDSDAVDNHVEVYISFLRKKFNFLHSEVSIATTRGVGYSLEVASHV